MTAQLSERVLLQALEQLSEYVEAGDHPTDALQKTAAAHQLTPPQIRLLQLAFNNGRSIEQISQAERAADKYANFPLADADAAIRELYPAQVPTPAEQKTAAAVDPVYSSLRPPVPGKYVTAAEARYREGSFPVLPERPLPQDVEGPLRRLRAEREKLANDETAARLEVNQLTTKLAAITSRLVGYLRLPSRDRVKYAELAQNTAASYGVFGAQLLKVAKTAAACQDTETGPVTITHAVDASKMPYAAIYEGLQVLRKCAQAHRHWQRAKQAKADWAARVTTHQQREQAIEFVPYEKSALTANQLIMANLVSRSGGGLLDQYLGLAPALGAAPSGSQLATAEQEAAEQQIGNPQHEDELRGIQAKATLAGLMSGDPVIHGYDPASVAHTFNDLVGMAPNLATSPLVLQSVLRKRLAAGVTDPHEAGQILELHRGLRNPGEARSGK